MRTPSRALRVAIAIAVLTSLLAVSLAPALAQPEKPGEPGRDFTPSLDVPRHLESAIYFPWVSNGEDFGLGPTSTMISIQNLEDRDAEISISGGPTTYLAAYASKTFTADELGISGGRPVSVTAVNSKAGYPAKNYNGREKVFPIYWDRDPDDTPYGCFIIDPNPPNNRPPDPGFAPFFNATWPHLPGYQERLSELPTEMPRAFVALVDIPAYTWTRWNLDTGPEWIESDLLERGPFPKGTMVTLNGRPEIVEPDLDDEDELDPPEAGGSLYDLDVWLEVQAIWDVVQSAHGEGTNPFGGLGVESNCNAWVNGGVVHTPVAIAGVAMSATNGGNLPFSNESNTAVSGYNALNGWEVLRFDEWYLPIVQTNHGWDSVIRVSALGGTSNAVTVRFFPADDGSGSLKTGFQLQYKINGGTTWNIKLSDYVPEDWVGSAHIYSDGAVYAMVDRFKPSENMWITNTGSSADFENKAQYTGPDGMGSEYVLYAPHVLIDYFGWNTGINVANLVDEHNNVSIQYFNLFGNATQSQSKRLAPHGMTYFYDSSAERQDWNEQTNDDFNHDIVGSALIWSDYPVAAVVDATKYAKPGDANQPGSRQATSYSATQNVFTWQAVPYVSKGTPTDGRGATSGINIMNPNPVAVHTSVYWVNQSGFNAQNFGISGVSIPAFANGFVYSLAQHNLPNGFYGAAQVVSSLPVAAASANVNYDVSGDGAVIFNGFNPCGLFRVGQGDNSTAAKFGRYAPDCTYGDAFEGPVGSANVYLTVIAEDPPPAYLPVIGMTLKVVRTDSVDFPYQRDGVTNAQGRVEFNDLPVGTYDVILQTKPSVGPSAGYDYDYEVGDVITRITVEHGQTANPSLTIGVE